MKTAFDYPALIRGIPRHQRKERHILTMMRGQADIVEVDPARAPLVFQSALLYRNASAGSWDNYRYMDGRFYALVDSTANIHTRLGGALTILMADVARAAVTVPSSDLWPPQRLLVGFKDLLHVLPYKTAADVKAYDFIKKDAYAFIESITDCNDDDVAYWAEKATDYASSTMICDGKVWTEVPEPVLLHTTNNDGRDGMMVADMSLYNHVDGQYVSADALNPHLRVYPVNDFGRLRAKFGSDREFSERDLTDVIVAEVFGEDFAEKELVRLATGACFRFEKHFLNQSTKRPLKTTNGRFACVYGELSAALAAGDIDQIDETLRLFAMELTIQVFDMGRHADGSIQNFSRALESNTRRVSEYWNDRPIGLPVSSNPHP
ncbi:hypothetical protein [Rhizobium sp. BK176]|uniref:hypothetical protein n=1 Tax=Rhizobium sp. BK176 TaxID=2587071 RepID=UPI0021681B8E|nr:hypothetical protein [Rhizobium sp. BK176]MCS4089016.1 hypothetical protein [Rhizobium sp. BK176]